MATTDTARRVIHELSGIYRWNRVSQKAASAHTGLSSSAISRRLTGEVSPTLDELLALADAAGARVTITLDVDEAPSSSGAESGLERAS